MRLYRNEYSAICQQLGDKPILIIDDESRIRHLLSKYFSKICFNDRQISHAASAGEAIEKIAQQEYGLIILDLMLLKSSGFEVIRHLIEQERETNLLAPPVLVVSGNLHSDAMKNLIARGVRHILSKPFNFESFLTKVQQAVEGA